MRQITGAVTAVFNVDAEVEDDATDEEVRAALWEACPKFPDVKACVHFTQDDIEVIEDERD